MNKRTFGGEGEAAARDYLIGKGWHVLAMNYRRPTGEIDIVATKRGIIAFIEVKRRTTDRYGRPAEAVTPAKRLRILRTAALYIQEHHLEDKRIRFDVIELTPGSINHIEGAFDATGVF